MDSLLEKIDFYLLSEEGKWDKAKPTHPGILDVPDGKDVMSLSSKHFIKLANDKGVGPIVKALLNLWRWNQEKDPKLSSWAKKMQETVSAHFKNKE